MPGYYDSFLSAKRLELVYQLAPPRVRQYLDAEIAFVLDRIKPSDSVIELGCGYGRVLGRLESNVMSITGVDSSYASLKAGSISLANTPGLHLALMNAVSLGFKDKSFDKILCIQNGISAFHVDPLSLIRESVRITRPGGSALFSSYSDKFWDDRLAWFRVQSKHGLVGEIDWSATHDGEIVCKDGFCGTTFRPDDFARFAAQIGLPCTITEVDNSSVFCEFIV